MLPNASQHSLCSLVDVSHHVDLMAFLVTSIVPGLINTYPIASKENTTSSKVALALLEDKLAVACHQHNLAVH